MQPGITPAPTPYFWNSEISRVGDKKVFLKSKIVIFPKKSLL